MLGPYANTQVRISVIRHDEDGSLLLDEEEGLGFAIFRADMASRLAGVKKDGAWLLVVQYVDSDSTTYRREFDLRFDTITRYASLTFKH
jgi:hypothetical protein